MLASLREEYSSPSILTPQATIPTLAISHIQTDTPRLTQGSNQLPNRPPNRQHRQQIPRRKRQKLQKQRSIHRQIPPYTHTQRRIKSTSPNPAIRTPDRKTEHASDEKRRIERRSPSDDIRGNPPEGGANAEPDKSRTGCVADLGRRNAIVEGDLGQGQGDALSFSASVLWSPKLQGREEGRKDTVRT